MCIIHIATFILWSYHTSSHLLTYLCSPLFEYVICEGAVWGGLKWEWPMRVSADVHWWEASKRTRLSAGTSRRAERCRGHRSRLTTRGPGAHNAIYVICRSRNYSAIIRKYSQFFKTKKKNPSRTKYIFILPILVQMFRKKSRRHQIYSLL